MPNLMAVTAEIVFSWMISLRTSDCVYVEPTEIGSSKQNYIGKRRKEFIWVSIVIKNDFVDDKVSNGDQIGQSEPCKEKSFVLLIPRFMDPLEEANNEAESGNE